MNLRKKAVLGLLATTLSLTIGLAYSYGEKARDDLIAATESSNVNYARLMISANWPQLNSLVQASRAQNVTVSSSLYQGLHKRFEQQVEELNIIKLKIFEADGNTIYSSDPSQVHTTRHNSPGFIAAMRGLTTTKLNFKNSVYSFNGEIFQRDIMSTYMPIYTSPGNIDGAIEIYTDVSSVVAEIRENQRLVYFAATITTTVLFILMLLGSRIINREENTQRKRREYIDAKTGLANLVLFKDRLDHALRIAKRKNLMVSVIAITMPRLQKISFNLNKKQTDELYILISNRMLKCIRDCDTLARQDNGDFLVVLESIDNIEATQKVAQRMIQQMNHPVVVNNKELYFLPSIGVTVFPIDGETTDSLIKTATTAMHKARDSGKSQFRYYTQEMSEQINKQLEIESQLLSALDRDEFVLHYQPLIDITHKKEFGVEALIRWNNKELGLVSPLDFIPMLEETGLIVPVGNWVLRTACEQVARWQKLAPELTVHVNLSAKQFHQPDLLDIVKTTLKETGLPPQALDLEITESVVIEDIDNVIRTLSELNKLGVSCSIDDFGTGYSSLSYLKRLPIQTLKIDRSFIKDVSIDTDGAAIVEAISALSGSLRLRVIAEGVENIDQQNFLHNLGIRYVQGFLYSKPLAADELESFLKNTSTELLQLGTN